MKKSAIIIVWGVILCTSVFIVVHMLSQAAHFYDNEILGYQAQSYRGKSSKKEWWYVAASKNCPDTGRRGPSTISLKNLC